ncbi:MAG: hypothetical protein GXP55_08950 [Deltaproteobacteria bacterium]|nr:hypothetical protein [Deltaproteobacteria bacterium]
MTRTLALALLVLALPVTATPAQAWDVVPSPRLSVRTPSPRLMPRPRVYVRPGLGPRSIPRPRVYVRPTRRPRQSTPSTGGLRCRATRNGVETRASLQLLRAGRSVASAACGLGAPALRVESGNYVARVTLTGTLDGSYRDVPVRVVSGQVRGLTVEVPTALLEVRVEVNRRRVFGRAIVRRAGVVVGSLGSGVVATLSPGRYDIEVIRGATRRVIRGVNLRAGQRRALRVAF